MKTTLQIIAVILALYSLPEKSMAQAPNMRTAANFVLFSSVGAISNTATSNITGNIGTDNGAITGFEPPTILTGNTDSGNAVTVQGKADLQAAYDELFSRTPTNSSHAPAFGSGETLFPGVYSIGAAGSVAGNLILDAQGDANAVFIFKFGGAFTTGASSTISLVNNASACNIYWIAEGAISMAASTIMKGTLIASNGAASMGAEGSLEGRLMSTAGAVSINQTTASMPCSYVALPVNLQSFKGNCDGENVKLQWVTANEKNNKYFSIERSVKGATWQVVGTVNAAGNFVSPITFTFIDNISNKNGLLYRLRQTDVDGKYKYSNVISVRGCENNIANVASVFPNPTAGNLALQYNGNVNEIQSIEIFNPGGQQIIKANNFQTNFDLSGHVPGVYFMHIRSASAFIKLKIVVAK